MPQTVSAGELTGLVVRVFLRHGVSAENAGPVAETVVAAERDGVASHGLLRLPGYVSTLKSGWVDGRAVPVVTDTAPGLVATEAANGFAQPALRAGAPLLRRRQPAGYCRSGDPQLAPLRHCVARYRTVCGRRVYSVGHGERPAANGRVGRQAQVARHQPDGICLSAPRPATAGLGPGVERHGARRSPARRATWQTVAGGCRARC